MDRPPPIISDDQRFRWFFNDRTELGELHDRKAEQVGVASGATAVQANNFILGGQFELAAGLMKWLPQKTVPIQ